MEFLRFFAETMAAEKPSGDPGSTEDWTFISLTYYFKMQETVCKFVVLAKILDF